MRKLALTLAALATLATSVPLTVGTAEAQVYNSTRYGYSGTSHSTMVRNRFGATRRTVYVGRNGTRCVEVARARRTYFGVRHVERRRCY